MKTLKELIPKEKMVFVPETRIDEKTIFHICRKILIEEYGVRGGENIVPTFYKEGRLFLSPRSSLWGNEVFFWRETLRGRINAMIGRDEVKEIKMSQQC